MIIHYLKIAWRNLWKYKTQSAICIVGLAVGFVCFALSALWIHYETTYDSSYEGADRMYLVYKKDILSKSGYSIGLPYPVSTWLKRDMPDVEATCAFSWGAKGIRKTYLKSGTEPSAGAVLIPDKVRTEILMEYLDSTHIPFLWQLVLCNSVCATLDYASGDIAAKADSSSVRRMTALKNSISEMITHPVLKQTLEDVYYQYGKKQAYQLPPCEGTDVFRKLTEPYQGKILLVDFWSIFCAPCRLAIEKHADLRAKYRNHKDVQFIFITSEGESPEQPYKEYVEKHLKGEAVYRIPSSDYQRLRELFSFNGIPRYVLIGRNGEVLSDDYRNLYSVQVLEKDLKALGVDVDSVNEIKP